MYTAFASVYDELMQDVPYETWAHFYQSLMAYYGVDGGMVAECACGTGGLTIHLAQLGFHVTGVDISTEMLFEASRKARKAGITVPFIRQDMMKLNLHRPMDAVLCTCDGLNYLTSESEVKAFFNAAYLALRPGGGIFFDVSTPYKLAEILGNNTLADDTGHITYMWQNHFDKAAQLCEMELCLFIKGEDGRYDRIDEVQKQRAHEADEITRWLTECGFSQVGLFADKRLEPPGGQENRWHFAAIKRIVGE